MNLILNILQTVPLFLELNEEEHQSVIEHITMEYYPAHHVLFEKGLAGDAMYIIKTGMVRIYNESGDLAQLGEGNFFGEMALLEGQARMASAETLSDCEVFMLKRGDFLKLLEQTPGIAQKVKHAYDERKIENAQNPNVN